MNERNFELVPIIKFVSPTDSFKTESLGKLAHIGFLLLSLNVSFTVCELAGEGVAGIFGPSSIISEGITGSICNAMEIPHVIYHWSPQPLGAARERRHYMTINVYPDSDTLARAMADIIVDYTWKSYTIIYETDEGK
jgi:glutamate receptor, ionotropic, invertebrate